MKRHTAIERFKMHSKPITPVSDLIIGALQYLPNLSIQIIRINI